VFSKSNAYVYGCCVVGVACIVAFIKRSEAMPLNPAAPLVLPLDPRHIKLALRALAMVPLLNLLSE